MEYQKRDGNIHWHMPLGEPSLLHTVYTVLGKVSALRMTKTSPHLTAPTAKDALATHVYWRLKKYYATNVFVSSVGLM